MVLRAEGFEVLEAESGEAAVALLQERRAEVVILDVLLPGQDGIATLQAIRHLIPDQMVIMISGHGNIATAVEATREGAFDFLEKPCSKERVIVAVRNALRQSALEREYRELKAREEGRFVMVGDSPAMQAVRDQIARAAASASRILIHGESGTGKELVARALHAAGDRSIKPFVKVNCAAIPEELIESELFGAVKGSYTGATESRDGKFLQADHGTLFLDEVGDMSLRAQAKVLRALQEGEIEKVGGRDTARVDVRVLAATNKDLQAEVAAGRFREDLFFRLNVIPILVPPLRDRREDIPVLANYFLARYCAENNLPPRTFSAEALQILGLLPWPGNVRELHNAVERLAIMTPGKCIAAVELQRTGLVKKDTDAAPSQAAGEDEADPAAAQTFGVPVTPQEIMRLGGLVEARRLFEAACIREALAASEGNVSQAARLLGIDRTNLHKKIQSYGLAPAKDAP
jgi:two-component system nitrogen regulation response regulator NtrX